MPVFTMHVSSLMYAAVMLVVAPSLVVFSPCFLPVQAPEQMH
jgi:hypothetical protein